MTITIKTKLDSGIYKSDGGGETRTRYRFSTGPRNLLTAINTLLDHRDHMKSCYGNIGCGASWLEIDGQVMHLCDLQEVTASAEEIYPPDCPSHLIKSRTQRARDMLSAVKSGRLRVSP